MSLYDDIEVTPIKANETKTKETPDDENATNKITAASEAVSATNSINLTFLKTQLEAKKALLQTTHRASPSTPAPVVDLGGSNSAHSKRSLLSLKPRKALPLPIDSTSTFTIVPKALKEEKVFLFGEIYVEDEYNPTAPTDYASFKQKREAQKVKEKIAREVAERLQKEHEEEESKRKAGAAIAPPQALIEQDKIEEKEISPSKATYEALPQFGKGTSRGLGVAASIMSKMGYREGSGLGRAGQGMSTALRVERTGRTSGLIISEQPTVEEEESNKIEEKVEAKAGFTSRMSVEKVESNQANITEMLKNSTKIVKLMNMVTLADIDAELEGEIREEMRKYGQIQSVVIHTIPNVSDEESVRVFVEFTNVAQAIKSLIDLNGRYFGGRQIRASFYPLDDFMNRRLDE